MPAHFYLFFTFALAVPGAVFAANPPAVPPAASAAEAKSVLAVDGEWQSDTGASLTLSEISGQPTIIAMFFTGCHVICPTTVESMQWVEQNLPSPLAKKCRFILVTLDPGGDTVKDLHAFRLENGLSSQWILLRGSRGHTRALADAMGLDFQVGAFSTNHTGALVLLDKTGRIVSKHTGTHPNLKQLLAEVEGIN